MLLLIVMYIVLFSQ